jgi:broad specificity phosphatase PhoE
MAKKTIYLIRHGETDYNKKGAVQGRGINADLNETGHSQGKAFFEKYQNVPFKKVYISTLKRTYQTAYGFIESGIPYQELEGLDEISWGNVEGKSLDDTGYEIFKQVLTAWQNGDTHLALEGGESPEAVVLRQKEALQRILAEKEEDLILITMHGRAMRILLSHITGKPLHLMDDFEHSNTCLYILEYDYRTEQFQILLSNDRSHLKISADL